MPRTLLFLCLLCIFATSAWGNPLPQYEQQARDIWQQAESLDPSVLDPVQLRSSLDAYQEQADALLNKAYRAVLTNLQQADANLASLFQQEQRAWLKFTENFCLKAQDNFGDGGTMYLTMAAYTKLRLWVERISWFRILNRSLALEE